MFSLLCQEKIPCPCGDHGVGRWVWEVRGQVRERNWNRKYSVLFSIINRIFTQVKVFQCKLGTLFILRIALCNSKNNFFLKNLIVLMINRCNNRWYIWCRRHLSELKSHYVKGTMTIYYPCSPEKKICLSHIWQRLMNVYMTHKLMWF